MITKAIIEEILSDYKVRVRIPILDSSTNYKQSTSNSNLSEAIICTLPKCIFAPSVGDIVLIGFEDFDLGKPVILGCLFKESGNLSKLNIEVECLKANSTIQLSKDTTIGDITYKDLEEVVKLKNNFQSIIDTLK